MIVNKKKCVAMLLAGGQGSRLGVLTRFRAKPAVPFGGKYRIIDFPLSNCTNSGIDTVGVLTQYQPLELNAYIGTGAPWDLDRLSGGAYVLPPYQAGGDVYEWYKGTANAIYQNIPFLDSYDPDYILVLSGDHIYKMDYNELIRYHQEKGAAATIAVLRVPMEEAHRFGILNTDENMRVVEFDEKPAEPKNDLASMGIYVFSWKVVREYLTADENDPSSSNDFGHDVLPAMLNNGEKMFAYPFAGYWKDVGTVDSLWEANMELLDEEAAVKLRDPEWKIYARTQNQPPHFIGARGEVHRSMICEGCNIYGSVEHSVLSPSVDVGEGAVVVDSILMSGVKVGRGAVIRRAIIDENVTVGAGAIIGGDSAITVIGNGATVGEGAVLYSQPSVSEEMTSAFLQTSIFSPVSADSAPFI